MNRPLLKTLTMRVLESALLLGALLTALFVAALSQVSSPDYHRGFWTVLPIQALQISFTAVYVRWVRDWSRRVAALAAAVSFLAFAELTLRVWF
jgi:hypothetical protein